MKLEDFVLIQMVAQKEPVKKIVALRALSFQDSKFPKY